MKQRTKEEAVLKVRFFDILTETLREGAQQMLLDTVQKEVEDYLSGFSHRVDEQGHRLVVRNGLAKPRTILTGIGPMTVEMPRVDDRRIDENGERCQFISKIVPPYLRRTKAMEEFLPWLYLKGISTGDMTETLKALVGPQASGLSAATIVRLKEQWQGEWQAWSKRSLADKCYVYLWADGVYFNVRLEDEGNQRQCILVLMGATLDGKKELIAIADGYRESEQSWLELLLDVKLRGLEIEPKLAVGDGALGFWAALKKAFSTTLEQRCWVHKTANILNKLPQGLQTKAKAMLHEIWMAETKQNADGAFDLFVTTFQAKYPKAVECLTKDRKELLAFYDFPAEHWVHIRTTNPIESTFATVRLRTKKTKGCGSRSACLTMVFKLARCAESHWRALNGCDLLEEIIQGTKFVDGIKEVAA